MEIKIKDKAYPLHFGWAFLEEVNKVFGVTVEAEGQEINTRTAGLPFLMNGLATYDPVVVLKAIKCATVTERSKPATLDLQDHLEKLLIEDAKGYKAFVDEMHAEVKKSPLLKAVTKLNG